MLCTVVVDNFFGFFHFRLCNSDRGFYSGRDLAFCGLSHSTMATSARMIGIVADHLGARLKYTFSDYQGYVDESGNLSNMSILGQVLRCGR